MTSHRSDLGLLSGISFAALGLAAALPSAAQAQSRQVTTPNVSTAAGETTVTLNGTTFVNKGLQGAGRLDANTRDFRNETLGSFSGMAIDLNTWRRNGDGSYSSTIYTLPDRGPFDGAIDYRNRVHTSIIGFRPLAAGSGNLPQATGSQSQVTITPTGGFTLKDANGLEMTGRDPGASTVTRGGITYPLATSGTANGRIALDAEAIAFRPDGSFYISDEYAAGIYYFNAAGTQIGAIQTVPALLPRLNGTINFDSTITNVTSAVTGRRGNQGLEAMAITPDNKKLVTILQSATVQDTNGTAQQTRNNTRILVYDITGNATPTNPIGHYVLQLPTFTNNGQGGAVDRTAAQSEMLALNDTQFLVLSRDGLGRGVAAPAGLTTPVFKSILLVDTAGATNLAGTAYETGTTPIATNGTLASGIVAVQQVELVNMLNPTQLARVGMNAQFGPTNATSLSEKWEALALAPVLEEGAPQDFFLFVGNDNDFRGTETRFDGQAGGAVTSISTPDGGNNDSTLLVYRLTLPTYADPMALRALNETSQGLLYGTRLAATALGKAATQAPMRMLNAQRGLSDGADGFEGLAGASGVSLWLDGDWTKVSPAGVLDGIEIDGTGLSGGGDLALGGIARVGVFGGYHQMEGSLTQGGVLDADSWHLGAYATVGLPMGIYVQGAAAWLGNVQFGRILRPSVYGQTATGETEAKGWSGSLEAGITMRALGAFDFTPFAVVDYTDLQLDGYAESGASVSNLTFPDRDFKKLTASLGAEVAGQVGAIRPALRAGYSIEREDGDENAIVFLSSLQHAMGTTVFALDSTENDSVFAEARIAARQGPLSAYVSGLGRWGEGGDDARVSFGAAIAF